jgi:hypothetical protein
MFTTQYRWTLWDDPDTLVYPSEFVAPVTFSKLFESPPDGYDQTSVFPTAACCAGAPMHARTLSLVIPIIDFFASEAISAR